MAKAGTPRFKLNREEFAELMESVRPQLQEKAAAVAASARSNVPEDVEVTTRDSTSRDGRPVVLVTIAHPSGLARQAKDGTLTRAAAENGLEVTRYPAKE